MHSSLNNFLNTCISFSFLRSHRSIFTEVLRIFLVPFPQTLLVYVSCTEHTTIYTLMYAMGKLLDKDTVMTAILEHVDTKRFEMNGGKHLSKSICS